MKKELTSAEQAHLQLRLAKLAYYAQRSAAPLSYVLYADLSKDGFEDEALKVLFPYFEDEHAQI